MDLDLPRLITLDLDDTLWATMPVIAQAERHLMDWLGEHASRLAAEHDVDSMRRHRRSVRERRPELAHDMSALRIASLQEILPRYGHDPDLAETALAVFLEARNRVEPYPEVPAALARLRRHVPLISLTNGNAEVENTPLRDCFDYSINAAMVGAAKPDPTMFLRACELSGVAPADTLHVGDEPWLDVEGARQVGMRTVWINRTGHSWPQELKPADIEIEDLDQLLHALGL